MLSVNDDETVEQGHRLVIDGVTEANDGDFG